jgi:SAM-dependent methyltransferase
MSLFYHIAYQLGITPWEDASETHGYMIAPLLEREIFEREKPYGSALDLGCGTGYWTIELAKQGWQTVGVDNVPKAVSKARQRAEDEGIDITFVHGDVTALTQLGIGSGYRFLLDLGCYHGLNERQRIRMGEEVNKIAAEDATLLELIWTPGQRGPLPSGATPEELEQTFYGWKIVDEDPLDAAGLPIFLKNTDPRCYRLRRFS